jgi:hypothetical protein
MFLSRVVLKDDFSRHNDSEEHLNVNQSAVKSSANDNDVVCSLPMSDPAADCIREKSDGLYRFRRIL